MKVPIRHLPAKLRCQVCKADDPKVVCLLRINDGFTRTRACGRKCVHAVHLHYAHEVLKAQLKGSVECLA